MKIKFRLEVEVNPETARQLDFKPEALAASDIMDALSGWFKQCSVVPFEIDGEPI